MLETVRRGGVKSACVPAPIRPEFDPEANAIRFDSDADEFVAQANRYELISMDDEMLYRNPSAYLKDVEM